MPTICWPWRSTKAWMKCSDCEHHQKCQQIRKKKNHILNRLAINKLFSTQSYNWWHLVGECCSLSRVSVKTSGRETSWPCRSIQTHQGTGDFHHKRPHNHASRTCAEPDWRYSLTQLLCRTAESLLKRWQVKIFSF